MCLLHSVEVSVVKGHELTTGNASASFFHLGDDNRSHLLFVFPFNEEFDGVFIPQALYFQREACRAFVRSLQFFIKADFPDGLDGHFDRLTIKVWIGVVKFYSGPSYLVVDDQA